MTNHHDELRVAPDPSRAEELRRRLHARLASGAVDLDDREGDILMLETEDRPTGNTAVAHRGSRGRWLLVAAAAVVVALVGTLVVVFDDENDEQIDAVTTNPTNMESPFVGVWQGPSPQMLYIDLWDTDTFRVRVSDEAVTVCAGVGHLASDTSLVIDRPSRPHSSREVACDEGTGTLPPLETGFELTLDQSTEPDQLVDTAGVVWSKQAAPAPDAEDAAVLEAFLDARVAGEGAEQYMARDLERIFPVPLLYATSDGSAYERFEIEGVQDAMGGATYNVRLFTKGGTVVQQGFDVSHGFGAQDGQLVVGHIGPTLENGRAVLLPFSIPDGRVSYGVSSMWREEWVDDAVGAFRHQFLDAAIVIAPEPLSVGGCENHEAPTDARTLAQSIVANPGYSVSEPVPVRIAGLDGLQLDVTLIQPGIDVGFLCSFGTDTLGGIQSGGDKMRLYLLERPGAGVVTVAVMTSPDQFEETIAEATPILDSIELA